MSYVFSPAPVASVPVLGCNEQFPVHRIYCVGRNYEEHAKEMGFTGREPPFFFMKPADAILVVNEGETGHLPYPSLTANFHHEIELVVAIGKGGKNIQAAHALSHIYGYAVGLDMTRRDLQADMKRQGRPWCIGKAFEESAPIGRQSSKRDLPAVHLSCSPLRILIAQIPEQINGPMSRPPVGPSGPTDDSMDR